MYRIQATKAPLYRANAEAMKPTIDPQTTKYNDPGDDAGAYVGYVGAPVGGKTRMTRATLGEQAMRDLCTLTRRVPGASCISGVEGQAEWTELEITIDSGACDTAMPTKLCQHISVIETEDSRRGMEYEVANGETIPMSENDIASS